MAWDKDEPRAITLARLKVAAPEVVCAELQAYHEHYHGGKLKSFGKAFEELELALQARNHPLIDLALARYGASKAVIGELYDKALTGTGDAQQDKGVRISVLANRILPRVLFIYESHFPKEEICRLAQSGDEEELQVLLQNPCSGGLLRDLYQQKPPFDDLPSDRLCDLVHVSIPNARVNIDEGNEHGPDLLLWDIHKGIWHMLATGPVEAKWMWTLDYLLFQLDPDLVHAPDRDVLGVLARWGALKVKNTFGNQDEDEEGFHTAAGLTSVDEFRCLIAALYGRVLKDGEFQVVGSKGDQDIALRCAYYGNASMKPEEMQACKDRDGDAFVYAALCNDSLFHDRKCRALLEDMISGQLRYRYAARCEQIAKRWKHFDPKPISESGAAVLDDIIEEQSPSGEAQAVSRLDVKVAELASKFDGVKSRAGWIMVGIIALLIWNY